MTAWTVRLAVIAVTCLAAGACSQRYQPALATATLASPPGYGVAELTPPPSTTVPDFWFQRQP